MADNNLNISLKMTTFVSQKNENESRNYGLCRLWRFGFRGAEFHFERG